MDFRRSYLLAIVSLALVPWADAGQKIEFSAPSESWSVPQPEVPDKDSKQDSTPFNLSGGAAMPDFIPGMGMEMSPTTVYLSRGRMKGRFDPTSTDNPDDPYARLDGAAGSGLTNASAMPRAWDSEPAPFADPHRDDSLDGFNIGSRHMDAFNPFGKNANEGGLANGVPETDNSAIDRSYWQTGAHGPAALERMREGQFIPFNDSRNLETAGQPNAAIPRYDASPGSTPAGGNPFPSAFEQDGAQPLQVPSLANLGEDNSHERRAAFSRSESAIESYYGGHHSEAPPAVLKFPHKPGDVFQ